MVPCETWFPGTKSPTPEKPEPAGPPPRSGSYTEDQESFLSSCVLRKLNPFTFFFIHLSWLFPLLWSCVRGPTILFSPQSPHSKLWRECLSIGLLTRILLSFRSNTFSSRYCWFSHCDLLLTVSVLSWAVTGHSWRIILRKGSFLTYFRLITEMSFLSSSVCCVLRGGCTDERDTAFPQGELRV